MYNDPKHNKKLGKSGEDLAANFLIENGYEIVERNFQNRLGEIDLVGTKNDVLVFFEVKTRNNKNHGDPLDAISEKKIFQIIKVANSYVQFHPAYQNSDMRIDAVGVLKNGAEAPLINHIENISG
jgi:putative endonuclease